MRRHCRTRYTNCDTTSANGAVNGPPLDTGNLDSTCPDVSNYFQIPSLAVVMQLFPEKKIFEIIMNF